MNYLEHQLVEAFLVPADSSTGEDLLAGDGDRDQESRRVTEGPEL